MAAVRQSAARPSAPRHLLAQAGIVNTHFMNHRLLQNTTRVGERAHTPKLRKIPRSCWRGRLYFWELA